MKNRTTEHGEEVRQKIYEYLIGYVKEYGYAPSIREIGKAVDLKSTSSVYSHLARMEEEGKIEMRGKSSPRAIKINGYKFVEQSEDNRI